MTDYAVSLGEQFADTIIRGYDIKTNADTGPVGSTPTTGPTGLVIVGNVVYFAKSDGIFRGPLPWNALAIEQVPGPPTGLLDTSVAAVNSSQTTLFGLATSYLYVVDLITNTIVASYDISTVVGAYYATGAAALSLDEETLWIGLVDSTTGHTYGYLIPFDIGSGTFGSVIPLAGPPVDMTIINASRAYVTGYYSADLPDFSYFIEAVDIASMVPVVVVLDSMSTPRLDAAGSLGSAPDGSAVWFYGVEGATIPRNAYLYTINPGDDVGSTVLSMGTYDSFVAPSAQITFSLDSTYAYLLFTTDSGEGLSINLTIPVVESSVDWGTVGLAGLARWTSGVTGWVLGHVEVAAPTNSAWRCGETP